LFDSTRIDGESGGVDGDLTTIREGPEGTDAEECGYMVLAGYRGQMTRYATLLCHDCGDPSE